MTISLPVAEPAAHRSSQAADPAILDRLDHWRTAERAGEPGAHP
jgi:hypothetical protein